MLKHKLLSTCLAAALTMGLAGVAPAAVAATPSAPAVSGTQYPELLARAQALQARLPKGWKPSVALTRGIGVTQWEEIAGNAINPDDYQCDDFGVLTSYLVGEIDKIDPGTLEIVGPLGGFSLPLVDAILYGTDSPSNTYGPNGEYTLALTHEFRDLKRFWDVDLRTLQMLPMHGRDVFSSVERIERTLRAMYPPGAPASDIREAAELLYATVQADPALQKGAHPLFTFNAVALSEVPELDLPGLIVMGDGLMQGMAAVGFGENAARGILAHEFGHQVQFKRDLFNSPLTGAEATRRTELMADAFGTYYLTHSRGLALNAKRLLSAEKSFYEGGDCGFTSAGHHGTPNQRLRSSAWGADVAASAHKQGHIQPSLSLAWEFDAALPYLTAPDAP